MLWLPGHGCGILRRPHFWHTETRMTAPPIRSTIRFINLGHTFAHLLMLIFPTAVLAMEGSWGLGYAELLPLGFAGYLLFGLGSLPAGWLADRWSSGWMMTLFFLGSGLACIATGLAIGPWSLALGLTLIGLFASIYHPVAIAWLVGTSDRPGRTLGFNGVFGVIGTGGAALIAGALADLVDWRAAFLVPGAVCLALGVPFALGVLRGGHGMARGSYRPARARPDVAEARRGLFLMLGVILFTGLVFQMASVGLPKIFQARLGATIGDSALAAGTLVSIVFGVGAFGQIAGGHLADRYDERVLYPISYALQCALFLLAAATLSPLLVLVMAVAITVQTGTQPIENCLLARYTPETWRATVYGLKFVLALGLSALGVPLIALIVGLTGSVDGVLLAMAAFSIVALGVALTLPRGTRGGGAGDPARRVGGRRRRVALVIRWDEVRAKPVRTVAGLMTGTSMDGLDVALCRVTSSPQLACELLAFETVPLPADLRRALADEGLAELGALARLDMALGGFFAAALEDVLARHPMTLELIGSHGQTVYHEHRVTTLQIGAAAPLAARFGCPVVHDFRRNDIAAGGAGAPLVPYVDHRLLGGRGKGILAVNIGGIANFTALPAEDEPDLVVGMDCGPGNMVLDQLAARFTAGAQSADIDGRLAARGRVLPELLAALGADPFFAARPPKSAGREQFGRQFVERLLARADPRCEQDWCDLLATAAELTAFGIHDAYRRHVAPRRPVDAVVVSGGGARNPVVMARLAERFRPLAVQTSDGYGLPVDAKEAIAFAILASERLDERPANLPSVTGARARVLLGDVTEC